MLCGESEHGRGSQDYGVHSTPQNVEPILGHLVPLLPNYLIGGESGAAEGWVGEQVGRVVDGPD